MLRGLRLRRNVGSRLVVTRGLTMNPRLRLRMALDPPPFITRFRHDTAPMGCPIFRWNIDGRNTARLNQFFNLEIPVFTRHLHLINAAWIRDDLFRNCLILRLHGGSVNLPGIDERLPRHGHALARFFNQTPNFADIAAVLPTMLALAHG